VTGARIRRGDGPEEELTADLVVDATGRGSRMPTWLKEFGIVRRVREEIVRPDISYTSCYIRRRPEHLGGENLWMFAPAAPHAKGGAALAVEGDRYVVSLTSYFGQVCPPDYESMIAFAKELPVKGLADLLLDTEPVSDCVTMRDPTSVWRHYEEVEGFPQGLLPYADAYCHFNPQYGQGMTIAAQEALLLERCLDEGGTDDLFKRFAPGAARLCDVPWSIVVGGDLEFEGVEGKRTPMMPIFSKFFKRVLRASLVRPDVAAALHKTLHLIEPPRTALFAPSILAQVMLHGRTNTPAIRAATVQPAAI